MNSRVDCSLMRATAGRFAFAALAAWSVVAPSVAAAGPSDVCFDAYERAQRLRKEGRLRATQEQLVLCAASTCPAFVARDCTQWSREVERLQPRVVFGARDERGADLATVQVSVDGVKMADKLDGRAMALDPGHHVVHYRWGARALDVEIILAEGVLRHVDADFKPAPGSQAPAAATAPDTAPPAKPAATPVATWALGGVAALAAGSFAVFALAGKSKESCAPRCSDDQIATLRRDYLIADVSLAVGLAALGGALYFFFTRGTEPPSAAPASSARRDGVRVELVPTPVVRF
jgi:hypothetical protein